jgi:hypothetical protein
MIVTLTDEQQLFIRSMGKALRVTAIATSDVEANEHMRRNEAAAVVAVLGRTRGAQFILLAHKWDQGEKGIQNG